MDNLIPGYPAEYLLVKTCFCTAAKLDGTRDPYDVITTRNIPLLKQYDLQVRILWSSTLVYFYVCSRDRSS